MIFMRDELLLAASITAGPPPPTFLPFDECGSFMFPRVPTHQRCGPLIVFAFGRCSLMRTDRADTNLWLPGNFPRERPAMVYAPAVPLDQRCGR